MISQVVSSVGKWNESCVEVKNSEKNHTKKMREWDRQTKKGLNKSDNEVIGSK